MIGLQADQSVASRRDWRTRVELLLLLRRPDLKAAIAPSYDRQLSLVTFRRCCIDYVFRER